ncbi:MAG: recombinase family protein [Clostridiales bacterium]|nr:recombinase family protein [Clostridiales bacterium]
MFRWFIAIYLRLSSDDKEKNESNSITNQKSLILKFLKQFKDIKVFKIYIDDGYTGTDFNRPGYQEMMRDIEDGKVNAVIVKDLSRLGRDYIGVGEFIEKIIPQYNLRFISVNDNADSYLRPNSMRSLEISFKSLMNDNYSKDSSNKMRSSLKASKEEGNFIGVMAPFGYIKDKEDYHKLIIDKEASKIIKEIFNMVLNGKSRQQIVEYLNFNHILTPSMYFKNILKYKINNVSDKWNLKILDSIIKNETYIGNLVQGRFERINHKTHNIVRCAEEDWIKVENNHDPIIDKKTFEQVQDILYGRNCKVNKEGVYDTFNGRLKCCDCGSNLNKFNRVKKEKKIVFFYCSNYIRNKKCTKHYITEKEIENAVIKLINQRIDIVCNLEEIINNKIKFSNLEYNEEITKIKLINIDKEIKKYELLKKEIIEDYKNDFISKEDFEYYNNSYMFELNNLKLSKEKIENNNQKINLDWMYKLKKIGKIDELNKALIDEFIDNIYIGENKCIKISFKYEDQYEELIKYLKSQKCMV